MRVPEFVPRVKPQAPQSPGLAAPGVAPVRDATGPQMAALGEGLQAAGVAADRLGDWIDETQAQSVYNLFDEELSKIESSYGQLQGKDAMDAYQKTVESVGAARKKFEGSLQNERQRAMFASRAQVRQGDGEVRLSAWGAKQTKTAKIGSLEAASAGSFRNYQNTLAFARGIPNEDARAEQEATARSWLDTGLRQREEAMRLLGSTDEQVAEMRMSTTSEVHAGVLESLESDPVAMRDYLTRHQGEMNLHAQNVAKDRLARAERLAATEKRDAAAWAFASRLSESGSSPTEQRAEIDKAVQSGTVTVDEAQKTWALVQNFADQKWQDAQRNRASIGQQLEQAFSKDPNLTVDTLPAAIADVVERSGMLNEATKIHREVRENRIADLLADGSMDSLVLSRDVRSINDMARMVERLGERYPMGDEAKTPEGVAKTARLDKQIKALEDQIEAIITRPRSFVREDDLPPSQSSWFSRLGKTVSGMLEVAQAAPAQQAAKPAFDMQKFTEQMRKALYPDSGR